MRSLHLTSGYWWGIRTLTGDCLDKFLRVIIFNFSHIVSFRYSHSAGQSVKIRGVTVVDIVRIPTIRVVEIENMAFMKDTLADIFECVMKETQRRRMAVKLTGLDKSKVVIQALLERLEAAEPDSLRGVSLSLCIRLRPGKGATPGQPTTVEELKSMRNRVKPPRSVHQQAGAQIVQREKRPWSVSSSTRSRLDG